MFESLQERSRGVEACGADRDQKGTKAFLRFGMTNV